MDAPDFSKEFQAAFEKWNRYTEYEDNNRKKMRKFEKSDKKKEVLAKDTIEQDKTEPDVKSNGQSPDLSPDISPVLSHDASP